MAETSNEVRELRKACQQYQTKGSKLTNEMRIKQSALSDLQSRKDDTIKVSIRGRIV